ncbi:MAG: hypothetical protein HN337_00025 [Deltaproteobacteria bacterium]|jgi:phosphate transport system protein|nr:hypothetical protein [Deltaproteobacteria bacterium]
MVLKELISLWHDNSALSAILKEFDEMIVNSKEMFKLSTSHLNEGEVNEKAGDTLKNMDLELNRLQMRIRRDVVTHLSVQGTGDIVPCLQLMSLTKDAERVGDYCKNIYEILSTSSNLKDDPLLADIGGMRSKILVWFDQTKRSFDRSDKELAQTTREEAYLHEKECDRIVWSLTKDDGGRNPVAIAMLVRFFKRVAAHLGNICTSVVMPLDRLDYFKKPDGTIGSDED